MDSFEEFKSEFAPVIKKSTPEPLVQYNGHLTDAYLTKYFCMHVDYFVVGRALIVWRPLYSGEAVVIDDPKKLQVFMLRLLSKREDDHLFDLMGKVDERKVKTVYRQLLLNPDAIDRGNAFLRTAVKERI